MPSSEWSHPTLSIFTSTSIDGMTIYGWDKSHYDGAGGNARAVREGFSFITHKAGGDADDRELAPWWADASKISPDECLLGAYWVLCPGNPVHRADQFVARLDRQCPGWRDRPFILQIDCERWRGKASTVPSRADIEAFCDRLHARMPKLRALVYAPKWVYHHMLDGLPYPLWASSYVHGSGPASKLYPGDHSARWGAYSGQVPAVLQFTSQATIAGQTTCDANAFRGSLAQLTALVAPGWVPSAPATAHAITQEEDMNLSDRIGSKAYAGRTVGNVLNDLEGVRDHLIGDPVGIQFSGVRAGSPLGRLIAVPDQISTLGRSLSAAIAALGAKDNLDENALADALAPGLAAILVDDIRATLADTPPADLPDRITTTIRETLSGSDTDELTALRRELAQSRIAGDEAPAGQMS
jgi:hypothetical protein